MGLQVTNDGETVHMVREEKSKFISKVDSGQLHIYIGHIMIDSMVLGPN